MLHSLIQRHGSHAEQDHYKIISDIMRWHIAHVPHIDTANSLCTLIFGARSGLPQIMTFVRCHKFWYKDVVVETAIVMSLRYLVIQTHQ